MPLLYRENNSIDWYKDTIEYLMTHRSKHYMPEDMLLAMHHPSKFLTAQLNMDRAFSDYASCQAFANDICGKWEGLRKVRGTPFKHDNMELINDCKKILGLGLKIHAIKIFRIATGCDLKESKDIIESL